MSDPTKELIFQNEVIAQMFAAKRPADCEVTFFLSRNIWIVTA